MNPSGHTVLITGGATGIGFAIAKKFYAAGNRVIVVGRRKGKLAAAAAALPGIDTCAADVSSAADRDSLVATYSDASILVNNAGIQNIVPILESTPRDIEHELDVNFLSPVLLCRAFLPLLLRRQSAAIVNVSSGLALVPKQTASIYCASKAALHSFSKTLRWQLEGTTVKVFEVLPSVVDTAMTAGRGRAKISPDRLAEEFWGGFQRDRYEMRIGLVRLFALLHRLAPSVVERLVRPGR
jgi:short-subunit dehydrogenase involved in D-alanine esterification of teichoic acids